MPAITHWEREMSAGGLEIYVRVSAGRQFKVAAWPAHDARALVRTWAEQVGVTLPEPEQKPRRPTPAVTGIEAVRRGRAARAAKGEG